MKLWFLDNSYTDYVIFAVSEDEAWHKLEEKIAITRENAYGVLIEVMDGHTVDSPNDLHFVM